MSRNVFDIPETRALKSANECRLNVYVMPEDLGFIYDGLISTASWGFLVMFP